MKECVTHHAACDCREVEVSMRIAALQRERDNWQWEYENLKKFADDFQNQRDALLEICKNTVATLDLLGAHMPPWEDDPIRAQAAVRSARQKFPKGLL